MESADATIISDERDVRPSGSLVRVVVFSATVRGQQWTVKVSQSTDFLGESSWGVQLKRGASADFSRPRHFESRNAMLEHYRKSIAGMLAELFLV